MEKPINFHTRALAALSALLCLAFLTLSTDQSAHAQSQTPGTSAIPPWGTADRAATSCLAETNPQTRIANCTSLLAATDLPPSVRLAAYMTRAKALAETAAETLFAEFDRIALERRNLETKVQAVLGSGGNSNQALSSRFADGTTVAERLRYLETRTTVARFEYISTMTKAIYDVDEAIKIQPSFLPSHFTKGHYYFLTALYSRDFSGVISSFTPVINILMDLKENASEEKGLLYALTMRTCGYAFESAYSKAYRDIEFIKIFAKLAKGPVAYSKQTLFCFADTMRSAKKFEDAIAIFTHLIEQQGGKSRLPPSRETIDFFVGRGRALSEAGYHDRAIEDFEWALSNRPNYAPALVYRCEHFKNTAPRKRALEFCKSIFGGTDDPLARVDSNDGRRSSQYFFRVMKDWFFIQSSLMAELGDFEGAAKMLRNLQPTNRRTPCFTPRQCLLVGSVEHAVALRNAAGLERNKRGDIGHYYHMASSADDEESWSSHHSETAPILMQEWLKKEGFFSGDPKAVDVEKLREALAQCLHGTCKPFQFTISDSSVACKVPRLDYATIVACAELIDKNPVDYSAYFDRAEAYKYLYASYRSEGHLHKALSDFSKVIAAAPKCETCYIERGDLYAFSGYLDRAIDDYTNVIRLDPSNVRGYAGRGRSYRAKGDHAGAIPDFTKGIEIDPERSAGWLHLRGLAKFSIGDLKGAVTDLRGAFERGSTSSAIDLYLARSRAGETAGAELEEYAKRLASGEWPFAVIELFLGKRQPESALDAASAAASIGTEYALCEAHYYIGQWHVLRGNTANALTSLDAAIWECPTGLDEYASAAAELRRLRP